MRKVSSSVGLVGSAGYFMWMMMTEHPDLEDHGWVQWAGGAVLVAMLTWLVRHMMHTW